VRLPAATPIGADALSNFPGPVRGEDLEVVLREEE